MPLYKFNKNDVYTNSIVTYPSLKFTIYSGSAYYNNTPNISGSFTSPIRLTDAGSVSLYELNIDRSSSDKGYVAAYYDNSGVLIPSRSVPNTGIIYPWVVKNGTRIAFRTTTEAVWNEYEYGDVITGSYPLTSSISKQYFSASSPRTASIASTSDPGYVCPVRALKNTINYYGLYNPNFTYSPAGVITRDLETVEVGLLQVPSIFCGAGIKKGTIDLRFYYTGSLIGRAQDIESNGLLYETTGNNTGSVIGLALYHEGILVLTGTNAISSNTDYYTSSTGLSSASWVHFAQSISGSITAPSSSFIAEMSGTQKVNTMTMFATAPKGHLNHSNNPSYLTYSSSSYSVTSSKGYSETSKLSIKNIVSSSWLDPTGSFEKTTYVSKIGIYDENRNLIAVAKLATPVKKTAERDFTFKIKLDI